MDTILLLLQILILIVFVIGYFLIKNLLPSYLNKKGENLATKEDISEITKKVEEVKSQYTSESEELKSSLQLANQIHTAAFDIRLKKYQQALTLLLRLAWDLETEKLNKTISSCETWWYKNCLYLDKDTREVFHTTFRLAGQFKSLKGKDKQNIYNEIVTASDTLLNAIDMSPLTKEELKNPRNVQ